MTEQFDIDLHPVRINPTRTAVSTYELESLWEAHAKTSIQLEALKEEYSLLKRDYDQKQANLEEANKLLMLQSAHLDDEMSKNSKITELLNSLLSEQTNNTRDEMKDKATQIYEETIHMVPIEGERADSFEKEWKEKLAKMEAMFDIIKREKESLQRQNAKLKSKLRILSQENEYLDQSLGTTISKQGRFEVRKWVECEKCCQRFSSKEELEESDCYYHPKQTVPYEADGKKQYLYMCCSKLVKKKGEAHGCCQGKHFLNMKNG